jgi:hypothetical protein
MENQEETRFQPKIFMLFVIIGLLPMAIGSLVLLSGARNAYQDVIGSHLSVIAENAQIELNNHFRGITAELNSLALTPEVRSLIYQSNQKGLDRDPEEVRALWAKPGDQSNALVKNTIDNPASRFLREHTLSSSFRELIVTDAFGRTIAASHRNDDYYLADRKWWRYAFREGTGGRFIGDIEYRREVGHVRDGFRPSHRSTVPASESSESSMPIVDSEEILNLVNTVKVGEQGYALLLASSDSTILVGPGATFKDKQRFKYFDAVRTAIDNGNRAILVGEGNERYFLGLPPFRLKDSLPELDWVLPVSQPRNEALSFFRNINSRFAYIILFTVVRGRDSLGLFLLGPEQTGYRNRPAPGKAVETPRRS